MTDILIHLVQFSEALLYFSLFPFLIKRIEIRENKRLFVWFIAFVVISEIITNALASRGIHNLGFGHFYFTAEFFFFFFILYTMASRFKLFWLMSGALVGVAVLLDNFIITPFSKFPIFSTSLQNLFLFLFSAHLIIEITTTNFIPFYRDERFYVAVGIFIYSCITALMFLFYNFLTVILPYDLGNLSMICMNFFFTYSMVLHFRKRKMLAEAFK